MIAVIGYPGESKHVWKRVRTKAEAWAWIDETIPKFDPAVQVSKRITARVITEKAASKMRYRDGRRCYPKDAETEYYAEMV